MSYNLNELLKSRNLYEEGQWFAKIKVAEHFYTELAIRGDEKGTFPRYFSIAESLLSKFEVYEKIGLDFLRRYIPDDETNKYEVFSITVDDFMHGEEIELHYTDLFGVSATDFLKESYSEIKNYSEGFILTFIREFNDVNSFLFDIRFLPINASDIDFCPIGVHVHGY